MIVSRPTPNHRACTAVRWPLLRLFGAAVASLIVGGNASAQAVKTPPRTGPDRVLVVINKQSAASGTVGRYYVQHRGIAASHVVRVSVSPRDEITRADFRTKLLEPIREAIDALPERIDFIVLTTGTPLRIRGGSGYAVDAHLAGMRLSIPPMVGFDTAWLARHRSPYFNSKEPFNSERFGMYLVTRLDCAKVADCLALVDRSIAARPVRGPFLFDARPTGRKIDGYEMTNRQLYQAATWLKIGGFNVQFDSTTAFVAPTSPVMGYTSWGSNDGAFDPKTYHAIRFLPGALAETFVSTSARSFGPVIGGQSRIVDLIAQGVTGAKGYVSEPYTAALVNPGILFDRYLRGFTLAEAFYAASLMVLWKDLVIGDPLCAPYAKQ